MVVQFAIKYIGRILSVNGIIANPQNFPTTRCLNIDFIYEQFKANISNLDHTFNYRFDLFPQTKLNLMIIIEISHIQLPTTNCEHIK